MKTNALFVEQISKILFTCRKIIKEKHPSSTIMLYNVSAQTTLKRSGVKMKYSECNKSRRKRKVGRFILSAIVCLCLICFINFIPTFNLETSNMSLLEGKWVNVYYETEKDAAEDVFQYADAETEDIAEKLGFDKKQNINIYIYDHQSTMQKKKYGYIGPLLGLDWYICKYER